MAGSAEFIIMIVIGVFFTLQGYEIISIGKPGPGDSHRLGSWQKAQTFYRWGGPLIAIGGIALWVFSR